FNVRIHKLMKIQKWNQKIKTNFQSKKRKQNGKKNYLRNNMRFYGNPQQRDPIRENTICISKKAPTPVVLAGNHFSLPNQNLTGIADGQVLTKKSRKEKSSKKPILHTEWFVQKFYAQIAEAIWGTCLTTAPPKPGFVIVSTHFLWILKRIL